MNIFKFIIIVLLSQLYACNGQTHIIHVGAKAFTEQYILAEFLSNYLSDQGYLVGPVIYCNDTFTCHQALKNNTVDILVEYTGTGLVFKGQEIPQKSNQIELLQQLYQKDQLYWLTTLGFSNSYQVVMLTNRTAQFEKVNISELGKYETPWRLAIPYEFQRRPLDGLEPLAMHYGLRFFMPPSIINENKKRADALLAGKADIAIMYNTDGSLLDSRFTTLPDDLHFFHEYQAALLIHDIVKQKFPNITKHLMALTNAISTKQMQDMNYLVSIEGRTVKYAARQLYQDLQITQPNHIPVLHNEPMEVAIHEHDDLNHLSSRVINQIKQALPHRSVKTTFIAENPIFTLKEGNVRLALVGAERFFQKSHHADQIAQKLLQAVTVIDNRMLHFIKHPQDTRPFTKNTTIGIQSPTSSAYSISQQLLSMNQMTAKTTDSIPSLLQKLHSKELDALFVLADIGNPHIYKAVANKQALITEIPDALRQKIKEIPCLRKSRLPAFSYVNQTKPIDSMRSQIVLIAPSQNLSHLQSDPFMFETLQNMRQPFKTHEVLKLWDSSSAAQAPDPSIPASHKTTAPSAPQSSIFDSIINFFAVLFLIWVFFITVRKET